VLAVDLCENRMTHHAALDWGGPESEERTWRQWQTLDRPNPLPRGTKAYGQERSG